MPTYEYECEKCGQRFEAFQSITAEPLTKCKNEQCDGSVKRLFSAGAGFIFKGSGFYITDYRSDSYKKSAQSDGSGVSAVSPGSMKTTPPASTKASEGSSTAGSTGSSDGAKKSSTASTGSSTSSSAGSST